MKRKISLADKKKTSHGSVWQDEWGEMEPSFLENSLQHRIVSGSIPAGTCLFVRHSFRAVLNITEITNIEQGHRSQSGNCQFFLSKESVLVTQQYGQSGSGETHSLENPVIFSLNNTIIVHSVSKSTPCVTCSWTRKASGAEGEYP